MNPESKIPGFRRTKAATELRQKEKEKRPSAFLALAMPLIGGLVGGFLGNAFLESAKSADSFRRFVLTDIYRPLQQQFPECLHKRTEHAKSLAMTAFGAGLVHQTVAKISAQMSPDTPIGKIDPESIDKMFKPINEPMLAANKLAGEVTTCWNQYLARVDEMAVVLGLGKEVAAKKLLYWQQNSERLRLVERDSKGVETIFNNPGKLVSDFLVVASQPNQPQGTALKPVLRNLESFHKFLQASANAEMDAMSRDQLFHGEMTNIFLPTLAQRQQEPFWKLIVRSLGN